jgi:hypothetical protein
MPKIPTNITAARKLFRTGKDLDDFWRKRRHSGCFVMRSLL